MTTRFEEAMEDLRERSQGPCLLETQKYLRDLNASHKALLKELIAAQKRHNIGRHDDDCPTCAKMQTAICAAEELSR